MEAPGQLPSLPSPKSGAAPVVSGRSTTIQPRLPTSALSQTCLVMFSLWIRSFISLRLYFGVLSGQ